MIRGVLRRSGASACLVAALVLAGGVAARADEPAPTVSPRSSATPTASPSASPSASAADDSAAAATAAAHRAAVKAIAERVAALQAQADTKGRAAQKLDEKANDLKAEAETARQAASDADVAADAAAARARESRARAASVAARLARTDYSTLPLDLMLNGRSADGVLGGLSTAGQLSGEAKVLYRAAVADEAEARRLQAERAAKAAAAARASAHAAKASASAKKEAASAETAVSAALAEQQRILGRAGDDEGTTLADTCAALGSTDVSACTIPGDGVPAGSGIGAKVVAFARAQIGEPYVFAAAGPSAWDCSGLTLGAWASVGVSIGIHSATAQYRLARDSGDLVPLVDAEPGDLLFYTDGGGDMYHVTIYAGNGRMVEAPYPGSVVREVPVRQGDLLQTAAHFH